MIQMHLESQRSNKEIEVEAVEAIRVALVILRRRATAKKWRTRVAKKERRRAKRKPQRRWRRASQILKMT